MARAVFVSRLGEILREQKLDIGQLERRLRRRGHPVSRRVLRRLAGRRPVRSVSLDVVVPLVEELGVDLSSLFAPGQADGSEGSRRERVAAADAELAEVTGELDRRLRERRPDLYDADGRPKPGALERFAVERAGGRGSLSEEDLLALDAQRPTP